MVKRIKLFGLVIWEIETIEDPEPEEDEPMSEPYNLGVTITHPPDPPPTFGFVTNWGWDE
jgi:hypothetical protein